MARTVISYLDLAQAREPEDVILPLVLGNQRSGVVIYVAAWASQDQCASLIARVRASMREASVAIEIVLVTDVPHACLQGAWAEMAPPDAEDA